jgi:predicted PurR-regulated permease PerM
MAASTSTTHESPAVTHARERWHVLAQRLRTVTPEAIGRAVLTLGTIALVGWLVVGSWPALAPFVVGAILAYAVLPIANRLDAVMPRWLAAILAELVAVAILVGVAVIVLPPLLRGFAQVALSLPTADRVEAGLADLEAALGQLPEPVKGIALAVATETVANLQGALNGLVDGAADFVTQQILGFFGTLSFVLGLLVIPAWVLTVVADERSIKRRGAQLLAPAIRLDLLALARIVDRAFGTFLRVRVLLSLVVGFGIWVGLTAAEQLGIADFRYELTAAVLLGALQLIPEVGFYLGFFPMLLVLAGQGPIPALAMAVVYVVANRLGSAVVETRVSRGVLDVHPGLLIPALVVLSQFGPLWMLAAAPLTAILRDMVRYLGGRLSEPPRPANVLPGERPARKAAGTAAARQAVPTVYRPATAPAFAATPRPPSSPLVPGQSIAASPTRLATDRSAAS